MPSAEPLPIVLVPGLLCSPRLYAAQLAPLWRLGPVTVADHTRDGEMKAIARRILASAPPRFALAGLSMGGYVAFEILRQAPERVVKIAWLDTTARPDAPEQSAGRRELMELARRGRLDEVNARLFERLVHPRRVADPALRAIVDLMAREVGPEAFLRQQAAIMSRSDSRPMLGAVRCPALVLVGDADRLTPPELAEEIAHGIPGARLVVVPDCGHLSTIEQPAAVSEALVRFFEA